MKKDFTKKVKNLSSKMKIVVVVVVLAIIYAIFSFGKGDPEISYKTEEVKKGNIVNIVSETGEISTTSKTSVMSSIKGIVTNVYVENGDKAIRGQNLFSVTSTATQEERAISYSTFQSAASALNIAKNTYLSKEATAYRVLDDVSGHDEDETLTQRETRIAAESTRDSAYDSMKAAEATHAKAWLAYQATIDGTVKATANGTIANLSIAQGQGVNETSDALVIESDGNTWIELAVNETDIPTVKKGQVTTISIDALKNKEFTGTVERVDSIGTVTSGIVTYNVYVLINESDQEMKPGMTAQVDIQTQKKENVLVVLNSAIKPYQGGRAVQILDKKTNELIYLPIEVGIVGPTKSEVVNGLEEGQKIILSQSETTSKEGGSGGSILRVPGTR